MANRTKAEALKEAKELGVDVTEDNTVAEIEHEIAEAKKQDNETTPAQQRGATAPTNDPAAASHEDAQKAGIAAMEQARARLEEAAEGQAANPSVAAQQPDGPNTHTGPAAGSPEAIQQTGAGVPEFTPDTDATPDRGVTNNIMPSEPEEAVQRRAAVELGAQLQTLPHQVLAKLRTVLDNALLGKGIEPEKPVESELTTASTLPWNIELSTKLTPQIACDVVNQDPTLGDRELEPDDLAPGGFVVRQATSLGHLGGSPVGPAYVVAVDTNGRKYAGRLTEDAVPA